MLRREPQGACRIAARDRLKVAVVQTDSRYMANRIVFGHVEGIIGPHENTICPENLHEIGELMIAEDDRVEIDLPEISSRRQRQAAMAVVARAPRMVNPARIGREIPAAMHGQQLEIGKTPKRARKDQIMQRKRRLQGIADDIVEVEMSEALALREAIRVHHQKRAEFFGLGEKGPEFRLGKLLPIYIRKDLNALQAAFGNRISQI